MFACKVCREKDARIADLHAEIKMLRSLVSPPTSSSRIPLVQIEADAIMSGRQEQIEVSNADQMKHWENVESEAHRILSGTY